MDKPIQANLHSIETFGSVDGPGVRFVAFLQGCAMRCRYCHNVDTWNMESPSMEKISADDLLQKALRYRPYWGKPDSNGQCGGITVSGGEPLLQLDFLLDLFTRAKVEGVHTCIDTSGQPFRRGDSNWMQTCEALMKVTDLLLVDIKHIDPKKHLSLTGQPNDNIQDFFRYLDEIGKPIWIRYVLVPGVTDRESDLRRTRAFIDTLSNVRRVEVLPYHAMAVGKWEKLGIPYTLKDVQPPTEEQVALAREILSGVGEAR